MDYRKIGNEEWKSMSDNQKKIAIQEILTLWKLKGKNIKYDVDWFLKAYETSIVEGDNTTLEERLTLLAIIGNAFGDRDDKIKKLMSKLTKEEIKKYNYITNKFTEYEKEHHSTSVPDNAFDDIIEATAKEFNMKSIELEKLWQKVNKATHGVE